MRWYEGDIAQAVTTSKNRNAIFVVYVEGKDDKSTSLTTIINDDEISSKLESNNFVAIKVDAGSVSHNQFAAIYKNVPVPSIYFIGKNGKPIDIIEESSVVSDLSSRINTVIEKHTGQPVPISAEPTTAAKQSADLIQNEQTNSSNEKPADIVCENGVGYKVSNADSVATSSSSSSDSVNKNEEFLEEEKMQQIAIDDKVQRAKELVEQKRETKKQEESEKERQKEIERRKVGQDVQKLRRWQQDQELKSLLEERQRAKNEEKAARDRILAQIAQDKADRASRFGTSPPVTTTPSTDSKPSNSNVTIANSARLQFRMPDGSTHTQTFENFHTLQHVRDYIQANLNLPFRNYSLSTTFPRREFAADDNYKSMIDLELCPNAVVLILPGNSSGTVATNEGSGIWSLFWLVVSPILGIFNYFRNLIFPQTENDPPQTSDRNKRPTDVTTDQNQRQPPMKRKATESTVIRRQGNSNVHRLSDRTDSDDDNNTWNGNSTQQM